MTSFSRLLRLIAPLALCLATAAHAGPGAHGPNGEHLDAPGASPVVTDGSPRVEAASETFELVGRLADGRLRLFVDEYETNAPVLGAQVDVELGELSARAKFDAAQGDYVVDDAKLTDALQRPGEHPLVFTLVAGEESDLLEGRLVVGEAAHSHAIAWTPWLWALLGLGAAAAAAVMLLRRRRNEGFVVGEPT